MRRIVISNYNSQCANCGKQTREVHHIDANRKNNELDNLILLCRSCHFAVHKIMGSFKGYTKGRVLTSYINVYLFVDEFEEIRNNHRNGMGTWDRARRLISKYPYSVSPERNKIGTKRAYRVGLTDKDFEVINNVSAIQGITPSEYIRRKALS